MVVMVQQKKTNYFLVHEKRHFKKQLLGPTLFPKAEDWNLRGVSLRNTSWLVLEKLPTVLMPRHQVLILTSQQCSSGYPLFLHLWIQQAQWRRTPNVKAHSPVLYFVWKWTEVTPNPFSHFETRLSSYRNLKLLFMIKSVFEFKKPISMGQVSHILNRMHFSQGVKEKQSLYNNALKTQ